MKALQSSVRKQSEVKDIDKIENTDFDADTEDELSSKTKTTAENVRRISKETYKEEFDVDTEDESSRSKKT